MTVIGGGQGRGFPGTGLSPSLFSWQKHRAFIQAQFGKTPVEPPAWFIEAVNSAWASPESKIPLIIGKEIIGFVHYTAVQDGSGTFEIRGLGFQEKTEKGHAANVSIKVGVFREISGQPRLSGSVMPNLGAWQQLNHRWDKCSVVQINDEPPFVFHHAAGRRAGPRTEVGRGGAGMDVSSLQSPGASYTTPGLDSLGIVASTGSFGSLKGERFGSDPRMEPLASSSRVTPSLSARGMAPGSTGSFRGLGAGLSPKRSSAATPSATRAAPVDMIQELLVHFLSAAFVGEQTFHHGGGMIKITYSHASSSFKVRHQLYRGEAPAEQNVRGGQTVYLGSPAVAYKLPSARDSLPVGRTRELVSANVMHLLGEADRKTIDPLAIGPRSITPLSLRGRSPTHYRLERRGATVTLHSPRPWPSDRVGEILTYAVDRSSLRKPEQTGHLQFLNGQHSMTVRSGMLLKVGNLLLEC